MVIMADLVKKGEGWRLGSIVGNLTKSTAKLAFPSRHCVATRSPGSIHDRQCVAKAQLLSVCINH